MIKLGRVFQVKNEKDRSYHSMFHCHTWLHCHNTKTWEEFDLFFLPTFEKLMPSCVWMSPSYLQDKATCKEVRHSLLITVCEDMADHWATSQEAYEKAQRRLTEHQNKSKSYFALENASCLLYHWQSNYTKNILRNVWYLISIHYIYWSEKWFCSRQ